jgi:hypothetical protein
VARRRNLAGAAAALAAQGSRVQYYGGDHELDACSSSNNRAFPLPDHQSMVFRGVVAAGA